MKVPEHKHPLDLINLEEKYAHETEEESDDDESNDLAIVESLPCRCRRCGQQITRYHKYYYKCSRYSCDYSLHKFCAQLPSTLTHTSHSAHLLHLCKRTDGFRYVEWSIVEEKYFQWMYPIFLGEDNEWRCDICRRHQREILETCYLCASCDFRVCINCLMIATEFIIQHPSHTHPLVPITRTILCECDACGKKHEGVFYHCTTSCTNFCIHSDCVSLSKKLKLEEATNGVFSHPHPLTLSYSFPIVDQHEKSYPRCRICDRTFDKTSTLWIYKCDKCWFYTHVACATSKDLRKTSKNFEDADYPDLLSFPFPYETHSMLKHISFKENGSQSTKDKGNLTLTLTLTHMSHQHPLTLVDHIECSDITKPSSSSFSSSSSFTSSSSFSSTTSSSSSSSSSSPTSSSRRKLVVHNPMKKIELLCSGCVRPITSTPFYTCANEDESCNFALHEWCTRLPDQVQNHPGHPQHTLRLLPNPPHKPLSLFECDVCGLECNGFVYSCVECGKYNTDVTCAFIPEKIKHDAHPDHLIWRNDVMPEKPRHRALPDDLFWRNDVIPEKPRHDALPDHLFWRNPIPPYERSCRSCLGIIHRHDFSFMCCDCDFGLHVGCALFLPKTIMHRFDKHPLKLSYLPIENHKSLYFCEICEEQFDPKRWFYHCYECRQSIHCGCAPLILEPEKAFPHPYDNIYKYVNIKFGGMHNIEDHPHPLSFVQGIDKDGHCHRCKRSLGNVLILKCLQCTFAIHFRCRKIR